MQKVCTQWWGYLVSGVTWVSGTRWVSRTTQVSRTNLESVHREEKGRWVPGTTFSIYDSNVSVTPPMRTNMPPHDTAPLGLWRRHSFRIECQTSLQQVPHSRFIGWLHEQRTPGSLAASEVTGTSDMFRVRGTSTHPDSTALTRRTRLRICRPLIIPAAAQLSHRCHATATYTLRGCCPPHHGDCIIVPQLYRC